MAEEPTIDKLKMHSPDLSQDNIAKIHELFPGCVTEAWDEATGAMRLAVDFDQLRQDLSDHIVEGPQERYRLDWPGKRDALHAANYPITETLRPNQDESIDFAETKNLFIEGDNLEALKLLQESYLGKIKMIYIDPPYNTGHDFIYRDRFDADRLNHEISSGERTSDNIRLVANPERNGRFHSDWLSMMMPRLRIARRLLTEDGFLFVSIDENEDFNLRTLLNEIFGSDSFAGEFCWNTKHSQQQGLIATYHEKILVYCKSPAFSVPNFFNLDGGEVEAGALKKVSRANPASEFTFPAGIRCMAEDGQEFTGVWGDGETVELVSGRFVVENGVTKYPVTLKAGWTQKNQMERFFREENEDVFDTKEQKVKEFFFNSSGKLKCIKEKTALTPSSVLDRFGTVSQSTKYLNDLLGGAYFDKPKPVGLIEWLIGLVCPASGQSTVLDFFLGSATTGEAVQRINAKFGRNSVSFIGAQLHEELTDASETGRAAREAGFRDVAQLARKRLALSGSRIAKGHPFLDRGFRVLRVDVSNMKNVYYRPDELKQSDLLDMVDNVREDRTADDLLFQVLVDWGVDLTLPIRRETVQDKTVFFVDDNALVACFDKGITEELVKELARHEPLRVVFRDNGFISDAVKINVEQVFRQLSPTTEVKSI